MLSKNLIVFYLAISIPLNVIAKAFGCLIFELEKKIVSQIIVPDKEFFSTHGLGAKLSIKPILKIYLLYNNCYFIDNNHKLSYKQILLLKFFSNNVNFLCIKSDEKCSCV